MESQARPHDDSGNQGANEKIVRWRRGHGCSCLEGCHHQYMDRVPEAQRFWSTTTLRHASVEALLMLVDASPASLS